MNPGPRYRPLPLHRRWNSDIWHFGLKSHVIRCNWTINVAPVAAARAVWQPPIGWTAIWIKALALASRRRCELRTAYLPFPWARLYVHPHFVCGVAVERTWRGVPATFYEQFRRPDVVSLSNLDAALRSLKQVPVESVGSFRRIIRFSRLPLLARRLIWGSILLWSGRLRSEFMGTFAISPLPTLENVMPSTTPLTFMLYYGLLEPTGEMPVQILFDHRVLNDAEAYRLVRDVEATLNGEIVAELNGATTTERAD
jgi:hypothetical protein